MIEGKLLRNNDTFLKTSQSSNIISTETLNIGDGLGEHNRYIIRNGKLLSLSGSPLVIQNTVSPVLRENSWSVIQAIARRGDMGKYWSVGDYKVCRRHLKDREGNIIGDAYPFRLYYAGQERRIVGEDEQGNYIYGIYAMFVPSLVNMPTGEVFAFGTNQDLYPEEQPYDNYDITNTSDPNPPDYEQGDPSQERATCSGSTWGEKSKNGTQMTRFLGKEFADIVDLSEEDGDTIPTPDSLVYFTYTDRWDTAARYSFFYLDNLPPDNDGGEGKRVSKGINNVGGDLFLPSVYEITGDGHYNIKQRAYDYYHQKDENEQFLFYQDVSEYEWSVLPNSDGEKLGIFNTPQLRSLLFIDETDRIASFENEYILTRTPYGYRYVGGSPHPYFLRASMNVDGTGFQLDTSTSNLGNVGRFIYKMYI